MKKFSKVMALIIATIFVFASFAACSKQKTNESDLDYIKEKGEIIIGITEVKPMNYYDENGNLVGFDTEFAKAVFDKLGVTPKFIEINWDNKYNELKAKSIDCVWNGMTITEEGKKVANITKAYAENAQVVVMKKANLDKYPDIASMKDLTVAVEGGSAGEKIAQKEDLANTVVSNTQALALTEVTSGAADACIIDLTLARSMTGEGTSNDKLGFNIKLESEEYGVAFRKDSNVTEEVNKIMDELLEDGTLDKLAEKYSISIIK